MVRGVGEEDAVTKERPPLERCTRFDVWEDVTPTSVTARNSFHFHFRAFAALYAFVTLVIRMVDSSLAINSFYFKYFAYLTNWGWLLCLVHFTWCTYLGIKHRNDKEFASTWTPQLKVCLLHSHVEMW